MFSFYSSIHHDPVVNFRPWLPHSIVKFKARHPFSTSRLAAEPAIIIKNRHSALVCIFQLMPFHLCICPQFSSLYSNSSSNSVPASNLIKNSPSKDVHRWSEISRSLMSSIANSYLSANAETNPLKIQSSLEYFFHLGCFLTRSGNMLLVIIWP